MPEGIIDMNDMETIFSVTDPFGIHRESVSVELSKEDPGSIAKSPGGSIEITVPEASIWGIRVQTRCVESTVTSCR